MGSATTPPQDSWSSMVQKTIIDGLKGAIEGVNTDLLDSSVSKPPMGTGSRTTPDSWSSVVQKATVGDLLKCVTPPVKLGKILNPILPIETVESCKLEGGPGIVKGGTPSNHADDLRIETHMCMEACLAVTCSNAFAALQMESDIVQP
ncbi:hypothetical protein Nepgr_018843 [Nepenthes gracilis]|uniref:Uncharacterized protein n=1 Tax=Nepenthes gracilis TaxID=150966 RepID=A0AAD3STT2_NEPGR|nr:hypothetical protein Nepgr_018843 [Nepenthes gracilis]